MTKRRFPILLTSFLISCSEIFAAGQYVISGSVKDSHGVPIEFATIAVKGLSKSTTTNENGIYSFNNLSGGSYDLQVEAFGFNSSYRTLILTSDTICDFVLQENAVTLKDVRVIGKSKGRELVEGALNINAVEIKADVNKHVNLNDLVNRSAGIKVRREGGAGSDLDLSINGLSGNSIRYFIDGMPLDARGSEVNLDNIPINTVERVELYKGVVPAYLGSDALGGVVNIVTKRQKKNFLDASYGFGSFHTHTADLTSQISVSGTPIVIRPTFGLNYSKNDYTMKGVEVWSEQDDKYIYTNKKRFHDDYLSISGQIEGGVNDTKWADSFFIGTSYTKIDKEIQTGAMQNKVYGKPERHSNAWNVYSRYAKVFGKFATRLTISHTQDRSETVDTAFRRYSWDGSWIPSTGNEMNNKAKTIRVYHRPLTILNTGIDYKFIDNHEIGFNYMLNRRGNCRHDEIDDTFEPTNDILTKHILSLNYTHSFFEEKWQNMFFVKDYINCTSIEQTDNAVITGANDVKKHDSKNYWGGGAGSRFTIFPELSVKGSYEHSVRLPFSRELLGNGTTVLPNLKLSPEQSNNFNLGVFGTWLVGDANIISYELNGFIRNVDDYIRATISERDGYMQYVNTPAVHVKGMDFNIMYSWMDSFQFSVNGSWNDTRDMKRYKTDGNPSATYKNRVPNKPWLFGNIEASYIFSDLTRLNDKLKIEASLEWINWYYLNWETYGAASSKAKIPTQTIVDLGLTYSIRNGKYNFSITYDNLFDRLSYDNYMLQKPGRAIYAKFRIFIQ